MAQPTRGIARSHRVVCTVRPMVYERIKAAADSVGMSVSSWAAFTLGSAVANQEALRSKMTDQMIEVLQAAIDEGGLGGEHDA